MNTKKFFFDSNILEGLNAATHSENLRIAEMNIADYNNRTGKDVLLNYVDFKFSLVNFDMNIDIAERINFYISWFRNKDYNVYKQNFISKIRSEYDEISQDIRTRKMFSNISSRDIEIFNSYRDEFISKYKNFHPLGILSKNQEMELKALIDCDFITPLLEEIE
jgi:hypothetical protein